MRILLSIILCLTALFSSKGQEIDPADSTFLEIGDNSKEIESFQSQDSTHSPRLAALYSAAIPGLGQFYNEKYWKIPIIYALGAFAAFQIKQNHQDYLLYRNIDFILRDLDPTNDSQVAAYSAILSQENIERRYLRFKRDRDYWIILSGLFYVLNIVDATVDAHLREFNINEDLSLNIRPNFQRSYFTDSYAGLSFNFTIK